MQTSILCDKRLWTFRFQEFAVSNINFLLEQCFEWRNSILSERVQYRTNYKARLAPWIQPKTSNMLKKFHTDRKTCSSKISNFPKLEKTCSTMTEDDKADFERVLGLSRWTTNLFRSFVAPNLHNFLCLSTTIINLPTILKHNVPCSRNTSPKSSKNRLV